MEHEPVNEQQHTQAEQPKRPAAITVICIVGFIGFAISISTIFSDIVEDGGWYPNYLGLCALIGFACLVGIWQMKKWAVFAYTAFAVLNQILVFIIMGIGWWNITGLIVPAIVIAVALAHVKKMSGPENSWMMGSLGGIVPVILIYFFVVQPGVETYSQHTSELEQRLMELEEKDDEGNDDGNTDNFLAAAMSLREIAQQANEAAPMMVDSETRLDGAEVLPNTTIQYNYTLVNVTKTEVDTVDVKRKLEPDLTNTIRTHPGAQVFHDHKATVIYRYHDKNDTYVFNITITPEMYSLLNMPVHSEN
ncbi:MAG: hypothetical protein KF687_16720 [Cyclobacteriaceae bacterium]|nr:hypothetical protein [Cyclobacteriaceae bacterium]